ncbi:retrograde transporter [Rhizoctonia solani AG-1 IA]|uniref:Retrograde transporter n=1 Tax=Thanatephorus cucumeris (strain AG1-IA) TaxID=983506 RepID=L8X4G9_THACA|nr:retrograde transporter [Rhizoctonia solani AG-1 IA]
MQASSLSIRTRHPNDNRLPLSIPPTSFCPTHEFLPSYHTKRGYKRIVAAQFEILRIPGRLVYGCKAEALKAINERHEMKCVWDWYGEVLVGVLSLQVRGLGLGTYDIGSLESSGVSGVEDEQNSRSSPTPRCQCTRLTLASVRSSWARPQGSIAYLVSSEAGNPTLNVRPAVGKAQCIQQSVLFRDTLGEHGQVRQTEQFLAVALPFLVKDTGYDVIRHNLLSTTMVLVAHDLPTKFKKLLVPGKIQQIVCTGNVCDGETYEYLRTVAADVHVVRGDFDDNPAYPMSLTLRHPPLTLGVVHGHQCGPAGDIDALHGIFLSYGWELARGIQPGTARSGCPTVGYGSYGLRLAARKLIFMRGPRFSAVEHQGVFFVNPGSATGAWSGMEYYSSGLSSTPSFLLLDIQGPAVVTYVYQLVDGDVRVEKIEWRKPVEQELERRRMNDGWPTISRAVYTLGVASDAQARLTNHAFSGCSTASAPLFGVLLNYLISEASDRPLNLRCGWHVNVHDGVAYNRNFGYCVSECFLNLMGDCTLYPSWNVSALGSVIDTQSGLGPDPWLVLIDIIGYSAFQHRSVRWRWGVAAWHRDYQRRLNGSCGAALGLCAFTHSAPLPSCGTPEPDAVHI